MKRIIFVLVILVAIMMSCKSSPAAGSLVFTDVIGKNWRLTEYLVIDRGSFLNRHSVTRSGAGESFTLRFDRDLVSGVGTTNRYSAPYNLGEGRTISISTVRSTLMAPIQEPAGLREHDFFVYLQSAYSWNIVGGNLELNSRTEDGREIRLVFSL
jgi:hypothetical protein